jgi:hypothetical protein
LDSLLHQLKLQSANSFIYYIIGFGIQGVASRLYLPLRFVTVNISQRKHSTGMVGFGSFNSFHPAAPTVIKQNDYNGYMLPQSIAISLF